MKKAVCILASPRPKGNSFTLARKVLDTCEALGAETEIFSLYQMNFKDCVACLGCKKTAEECVLRDDLTAALRAVREADILILASPVYFGDVTGEMKKFIDRMYSLVPPGYLTGGPRTRLSPGKKCLFILPQGYPGEELFQAPWEIFGPFFGPEWFGYETHLLRAPGLSIPGEAAENPELMAKAEELGKQLMA